MLTFFSRRVIINCSSVDVGVARDASKCVTERGVFLTFMF